HHLPKSGAHNLRPNGHWLADSCERARSDSPHRGHRVERGGVALPRKEVAVRCTAILTISVLLLQRNDPLGVREGTWIERDPVHDTKDRAVWAEAECEGDNRNERERDALFELSHSESQILPQRIEPLGSCHRSLPLFAQRVECVRDRPHVSELR